MSDSLKIIFTGTGSAKTSLNRFHSSFLIKSESYNLLVDAGDGISRALLRLGIEFNEIDGILLTHFHADHFSGIASLIEQMKLNKRLMKLDIFVSKLNISFVKVLLNKAYLLEERLGFLINFEKLENNKKIDFRGKFTVEPIENTHLQHYRDLNIKGIELRSYSLAINNDNAEIFYSGDVGSPEDLKNFNYSGNSILITESTHVPIETIVELIKVKEIKKVILTHIDTDDPSVLISKISGIYPEGLNKIIIAHDGLIISV